MAVESSSATRSRTARRAGASARAGPTVLYVDWSRGFGGSSKSLALTLSGLPDVRKLLVTAQEPALVEHLFGRLPTWRFRRWLGYRTRARLVEMLRRAVPWRPPRTAVLKAYAVVDFAATAVNALRLARIIRTRGVDLVHINAGFQPHEAVIAARMTGVPFVGHLRGWTEPPFPRALPRTAVEAACTIAVSNAAGAGVDAAIPEATVVTIYDPVDVDRVHAASGARAAARSELGAADADVVVGIFGRIVRWKGQLEFVRACDGAMREDRRVLAVIVGSASDGSGAYMREVTRAAKRSARPERFVFTGYREDVEALYAAMDVVVHASTSPEPFGMVIPEAMAAGRPVVATAAGGPLEIVTHGVDGLLVPPHDVAALRRAILDLAADPDRRRRLGRRGRRTVSRRFTIERNARAVREVYRTVLDTAAPAEPRRAPRGASPDG